MCETVPNEENFHRAKRHQYYRMFEQDRVQGCCSIDSLLVDSFAEYWRVTYVLTFAHIEETSCFDDTLPLENVSASRHAIWCLFLRTIMLALDVHRRKCALDDQDN